MGIGPVEFRRLPCVICRIGCRWCAPYATYLALSILPHRAVENLHRLREDGLEGKYGLYEAAEYGSDGVLAARSWMSHHMGMSSDGD